MPQRAYSTLNVGFGVGLSADGGFKPKLKAGVASPPPAAESGAATGVEVRYDVQLRRMAAAASASACPRRPQPSA